MRKYTVEEFLLTYMSWQSVLQRAHYKRTSRKDEKTYRGIVVCPRWLKFEYFIEDMGARQDKGLTLDRFPNKSGNYEPGNCRWATAEQQAANTKAAHLLTFQGQDLPIAAWARKTGLHRATIQLRLKAGWSVDDALSTPASKGPRASFSRGLGRGKKLTQVDVQKIVERARGGETAMKISKDFDVTPAAVGHVVKQFGIVLKKGRPKCL